MWHDSTALYAYRLWASSHVTHVCIHIDKVYVCIHIDKGDGLASTSSQSPHLTCTPTSRHIYEWVMSMFLIHEQRRPATARRLVSASFQSPYVRGTPTAASTSTSTAHKRPSAWQTTPTPPPSTPHSLRPESGGGRPRGSLKYGLAAARLKSVEGACVREKESECAFLLSSHLRKWWRATQM